MERPVGWLGGVALISIAGLVTGCSSGLDDFFREAARGHRGGGENEGHPGHGAGGGAAVDGGARGMGGSGAGGSGNVDAGSGNVDAGSGNVDAGALAGEGGTGPGSQGGAGGSGGSVGGVGGGSPDGGACAASAQSTCTGTVTGTWCIDHFFAVDDPSYPTFNGVWSAGPSDTWAVGMQVGSTPTPTTLTGFAFHWDGCAWTRTPLPTTSSLWAVWGAAGNDVWAAGQQGTVLHWDGATWSSVVVATVADFTAISGTSGSDVWAIGSTGLFHWNGAAWAAVPEAPTARGDVWAVSSNDVWATTNNGAEVLHWNGVSWTSMPTSAVVSQYGLFGIWADASSAWAVGEGHQIIHFTGGTWTQIAGSGGSSKGFWDVMSLGGDTYAVGDHVQHAPPGGLTFQVDPDAPLGAIYAGVWLTPSQVWIAGVLGGSDAVVLHRAR